MLSQSNFWYAPANKLLNGPLDTIPGGSDEFAPEQFQSGAAQLLHGSSVGAKAGDLLALTDGRHVRAVVRIAELDPSRNFVHLIRMPHLSLPGPLGSSPDCAPVPRTLWPHFTFTVAALLAPSPPPAQEAPPADAPNVDAQAPKDEAFKAIEFGDNGKPLNLLLYGPPGTGKTYSLKRRALELVSAGVPQGHSKGDRAELDRLWRQATARDQVAMCTFHQSYTYEEFVEGIRPRTDAGKVTYKVDDGLFKRMALLALAEGLAAPGSTVDTRIAAAKRALDENSLPSRSEFDGARPYVLVIDEINRANISRVLGELITLLEGEKRIGGDDPLVVTLPTSKERFAVPPNLHIIGTLNTADRSIALMDVALRRRFVFEEMRPDIGVLDRSLEPYGDVKELVIDIFKKLNERLIFLYDREHQIGHAYFLKATSIPALRDVMVKRVLPLLQEYFFGQWHRVALAVGHPWKNNGQEPVVLAEEEPAILQVRKVKESDAIGIHHSDYADTFEFTVHPRFAKPSTSEVWLAEALRGLLVTEPDPNKRRLTIKQELTSLSNATDHGTAS